MNPTLLLSCLLSLSALALADDESLPVNFVEHPAMDCVPTSCGAVANIGYPFWVDNQQPSHCGFPAFKLACKNSVPILHTSFADYHVRAIFYDNRSVVLADPGISSNTGSCAVHYSNVSFSLTPFRISSVNRELVFLSNCDPEQGYYKVGCGARNGTFAYLSIGDDPDGLGLRSACSKVIVPVLDYLGEDVSKYATITKNGFLVEWTVADCGLCRESGGQCGYINSSNNFMCICPDRPHWRSCSPDEPTGYGDPKRRKVIIGSLVGTGFFVVSLSVALYFYMQGKNSNSIILWKKGLSKNQNVETFLETYGSLVPKRSRLDRGVDCLLVGFFHFSLVLLV